MQKQRDKPRLWCIFNADSGHWRMVNYEKQHEAVNASTAYTRGYEVHEMLCRSDVEAIIRESREAAVRKERERTNAEKRDLLAALEFVLAHGMNCNSTAEDIEACKAKAIAAIKKAKGGE